MTEADIEKAARHLQEFPRAVRQLIANLPDDVVRWKKSVAEFSIVENVCHLRDIEQDGYSLRLRKLLGETQPLMPDIDGGRLARERDYNSQPIQGALEDFAAARLVNVAIIRELRPDQLSRTGILETVGSISVAQLIDKMLEHDREHLELIEAASSGASSSRSRPPPGGRSPLA